MRSGVGCNVGTDGKPASTKTQGKSDAQVFVENWSTVWRGQDSDPHRYMELLPEGCPLVNPISSGTREDRPQLFDGILAIEPDICVTPTRWAETADGTVLIEWVNTGALYGAPVELHGADRFTLKDGKACEGQSHFDPRPFLQAPSAAAGQ